ncbi:MAG TPA: efflux RND transporter periplasmic adaptor subunit [Acetobacteraceae bacterium]|nr:efflux RND transporter periplasmic adaptor subunit [Acetobacteraceae bacterium]
MTLSVQQDGRVTAIVVTPGETVQAGQNLLEFAPSATARSMYQQTVTALAVARAQRTHTAQLLAQQLATRDQLAQADKAVSDAQANLDALRREGGGSAAQQLTAPFDGIVATVPAAVGDRVQPGAPLMTLTRADALVVTVGVEPDARMRVRPGQVVRLTRLSDGTTIDGRVQRVDGVLNPKTRQVDADVSVPEGAVISGESFRADIETGQLMGWVVPHDAVLDDGTGPYVYQIAHDKAVRVQVKLLGSDGRTDVVTGPIDPSRALVVSGNYQLDNGMAIREQPRLAASR